MFFKALNFCVLFHYCEQDNHQADGYYYAEQENDAKKPWGQVIH